MHIPAFTRLVAASVVLLLSTAAHAAPTTSAGQISISQVMEMVQRSSADTAARNMLIAYLAGVGETTGVLIAEGKARGVVAMACGHSFSLSQDTAVAALKAAAPDQATWPQTAATPLILADLIARAGCH
jgi:hypothetical protein